MRTGVKRIVIGCTVVGALVLSAGVASSRNIPGSAGRAPSASDNSCWSVNWTGLQNSCGSGTTNTKKLVIPAPIDVVGNYNNKVKAAGGALQTGAWVSCVSVAAGGSGSTHANLVSSRASTTASDPTTYQDLVLGTINLFTSPTWSSLYFDCDATYGGVVDEVAYWQ